MECSLEYIPKRLHTGQKPVNDVFYLGEELYYRCKSGECSKPYDKISLYNISHNRNFCSPQEYKREDVLFNILEEDQRQFYDLNTTVLKIKSLENNATYIKEIISRDNADIKATITLKHEPIPCMYPHSIFEVCINGIIVNSENYTGILNKKSKTYKNLRSDIRQELTSIIQTGNIDSSKNTEYIDEP